MDSLVKLLQCLTTLTMKSSFLIFNWNCLYFNFCPLPLVLPLGINGWLFMASFWVFIRMDKISPNLLFSRLNVTSFMSLLSCQMLQRLHHLHGPWPDSLQWVHVCLDEAVFLWERGFSMANKIFKIISCWKCVVSSPPPYRCYG